MDTAVPPSPVDAQEEGIHSIARPPTPDPVSNSEAAQQIYATPIRHRGTNSAAMSSSKRLTISKINYEDIVAPIKNEISKPQDCKATDMLRFLFSFCDTRGDAAQVDPKDDELMGAFEVARGLANEPDSPLKNHLGKAIATKDEGAMYTPLIRAFNYALDRLSKFSVPGLPNFEEKRQIVFARSDAKCIESESYLQGSYKPDIVLLKWNVFKAAHQCPRVAYSSSYEDLICCKSGCDQPTLSWRNLLSTIEVKRGDSGSARKGGNKGKMEKQLAESTYTGDFSNLQGDLKVSEPPTPQQSAPPKMVSEEYPTRLLPTRSGLRTQSSSSSTPDRLPSTSQKRHRDLQESSESVPKKARSDSDTKSSGTGTQKAETPSGSGKGKLNEREVESKRPRQAPRVQNAIYATHKISSSFDISHTINLILIGTSVSVTWIDRQNIIESRVIDLVDDLPHFLLLLLILQRFDDAKWGYFTGCPQSGVNVAPEEKLLTVSFVADAENGEEITIVFYPDDHEIYLGTTLIGRGTSVIGGRMGPAPELTQLGDTSKLRKGNDFVVKTYWPEESRTSEAEIIKKATEYGEKIKLIGNHIPEMVCHRDPNFLCSSTKTIRQFLGLPIDGSRCLRVIVFRRLRSIKELKEKDMLTAYLQCFFCHFCLWKKGIRHGDISLGNLMWDDERKVGVLNDFDLARFESQAGASGQDNTGTLPFMALDLLSEEGLRGEVPRRYRHEAESFTWCLICLCLATMASSSGKNFTMDPHPLPEWFGNWKISRDAKKGLEWREHDHSNPSLAHPNARDLACALHEYWVTRYREQFPGRAVVLGRHVKGAFGRDAPNIPQGPQPYRELDDDMVFEDVVSVHEPPLVSEPLNEAQVELFRLVREFQCINWDA